jgi:ADP-ribosylglycohydrolase
MAALSVLSPISVRERYLGLLYGSLVADSLALAPHWFYEQAEISQRFGRIEGPLAPDENEYHRGKGSGEQTHYGDQTLVLMESLESCGGNFVVEDFARRWRQFWKEAKSYRDHATLDTLARLDQGHGLTKAGSESKELGGATRIAPLLLALRTEEPPTIIGAVRAQTALTHATPEVIDAAEFIARMVFLLVKGVTIANALEMAAALPYRTLKPDVYLRQARDVANLSTSEAVDELGQSCPLPKAFPSVLAILLRHGDDLETALVENVHAGGDSAARGLVLGILLGAAHGVRAVPERWIEPLQARPQIEKFLKTVGLGEVHAPA